MDCRAIARWPSYFRMAWNAHQPQIGEAAHSSAVKDIHALAVDLSRRLPDLKGLTQTHPVEAAASRNNDPEEFPEIVRLFQWLSPELVINVAYFRLRIQHPVY